MNREHKWKTVGATNVTWPLSGWFCTESRRNLPCDVDPHNLGGNSHIHIYHIIYNNYSIYIILYIICIICYIDDKNDMSSWHLLAGSFPPRQPKKTHCRGFQKQARRIRGIPGAHAQYDGFPFSTAINWEFNKNIFQKHFQKPRYLYKKYIYIYWVYIYIYIIHLNILYIPYS